MRSPYYIVISPVRNEAAHIADLASCLISQTIRPEKWLVIDDGSCDGTRDIVRRLAAEHPFIQLVERKDHGRRRNCADIDSFLVGLGMVKLADYEFVGKVDGDVKFPRDYYEKLLEKFWDNPRLGIAGFHVLQPTGKGFKLELLPEHHVRGNCKLFRRACLEDIMPLPIIAGWDTFDAWKAMFAGWESRSFFGVLATHQKPVSGCTGSVLRGKVVQGESCYRIGYHPLYALARIVKNCARSPLLLGGLGMLCGYVRAWITRADRVGTPALRSFVRRQQLRRMVQVRKLVALHRLIRSQPPSASAIRIEEKII